METVTLDMICRDLEFIKRELMEIKERMVDTDRIMAEDDCKALQEYTMEKSKGGLTSHEELKKERGL